MENEENFNEELISLLETDEELQRQFMEEVASSSQRIKSEEKLAFNLLRN